MDIKKHFEYNPVLDLTAANIGINKWDWVYIDSEDKEKARREMKANKFDVLPVMGSDGKFTKFYCTENWNNYGNLICATISDSDTIYYRTSIDDLVRKFKEKKKHYYFLTNQQEVLGLVSYVNLNCNAVYNYLYHIIADLEQKVSELLRPYISEKEAIAVLDLLKDNQSKQIIKRNKKAKQEGVETTVFHFFYIGTLAIMLENFKDKIPPQFHELYNFKGKLLSKGSYGMLRNKIMHPVKPLLSDQDSISQINDLLTDYPSILEIVSRKVN